MSITHAALRARVHRLVAKWRPILGLESWGLNIRFDEAKHKATAKVSLQYEEATLNFNLVRIKAETRTHAALEELCLHELVHCLESPYDTETRVSRVTRSILRAHDSAR